MSLIATGIFPPFPVVSTVLDIDVDLNVVTAASVGSTSFPSANRAYYIPVKVPYTVVITKLFCVNGASVAGNFDIGVYDRAGTKIISTGSTAQSGTSARQVVDVTDTTIGPGLYYLALSSNNTGTYAAWSSATTRVMNAIGAFSQNTAFALPATATFATAASYFIPIIGFTVGPNTLI